MELKPDYSKHTLIQCDRSFCRHMKRLMLNSSNNSMIHSTKEPLHVSLTAAKKNQFYIFAIYVFPFFLEDTNQLANYTKMYEPIHAELGNLMRAVPDQLRNVNEATVSMCAQRIITEMNKDMKLMQTNLTKALKDNVKVEVCTIF